MDETSLCKCTFNIWNELFTSVMFLNVIKMYFIRVINFVKTGIWLLNLLIKTAIVKKKVSVHTVVLRIHKPTFYFTKKQIFICVVTIVLRFLMFDVCIKMHRTAIVIKNVSVLNEFLRIHNPTFFVNSRLWCMQLFP